MSQIGQVLKKLTGAFKPRTGELTQRRFKSEAPNSPVRDAVKLTSETRIGGEVESRQESARVNFANGNSLASDGAQVTVFDKSGERVKSFEGSVEVSEKTVTVKDAANEREQYFGADGSNTFFDNGRIVQLDAGASATSPLPKNLAKSLLPEGKHKWGLVKDDGVHFSSGGGGKAQPIFGQEWLVS